MRLNFTNALLKHVSKLQAKELTSFNSHFKTSLLGQSTVNNQLRFHHSNNSSAQLKNSINRNEPQKPTKATKVEPISISKQSRFDEKLTYLKYRYQIIAAIVTIAGFLIWLAKKLDTENEKVNENWKKIQALVNDAECLKTSDKLYLTTQVDKSELKADEKFLNELTVLRNQVQGQLSIRSSLNFINYFDYLPFMKGYVSQYQNIIGHLNSQLEWLEIALAMQEALLGHKKKGKFNYTEALDKVEGAIQVITQYTGKGHNNEVNGIPPKLPIMAKINLLAAAYNRKAKLQRCLGDFTGSFNSYEQGLAAVPGESKLLYSQGFLLLDLAKMVLGGDIKPEALNTIIERLVKFDLANIEKISDLQQPANLANYLTQKAIFKQNLASDKDHTNPNIQCAKAVNLQQSQANKPKEERSLEILEEAEYYFKVALGYDKNTKEFISEEANIYVYYGDLLLDLDRAKDAIAMFDKAIQYNKKALYLINSLLINRQLLTLPDGMTNTRQAQDIAAATDRQIFQQEKLYKKWQVEQLSVIDKEQASSSILVKNGVFKSDGASQRQPSVTEQPDSPSNGF